MVFFGCFLQKTDNFFSRNKILFEWVIYRTIQLKSDIKQDLNPDFALQW